MPDYSTTKPGLRLSRRLSQNPGNTSGYPHYVVQLYFLVLCVTTLVRAAEAGIVASMMPDIKEALQFSYTKEGTLASTPDYGLIPSGLIAMIIFSYIPAKIVMSVSLIFIPFIMLILMVSPTTLRFCIVRAVCGLAWGFACVHYPVWIHRYGLEGSRTMWLGLYNACLILGILLGFIIGVACSATGYASWATSYAVDAWIMLGCAAGAFLFPAEVVQVVQGIKPLWGDTAENSGSASVAISEPPQVEHAESPRPWYRRVFSDNLIDLLTTKLFILLMVFSGCIAGNAALLIYFLMQLLKDMGYEGATRYVTLFTVFVLGPAPGNILGATILSRLGGYQNFSIAFRMFVVCTLIACVSSGCFTLFACLEMRVFFAIAMWLFIFVGGMPSAAVNGIAVSLTPASHLASGMQFFVQNTAKLIVPQIGGVMVDLLGVKLGVCLVINCTLFIALIVSYFGKREVDNNKEYQASEEEVL